MGIPRSNRSDLVAVIFSTRQRSTGRKSLELDTVTVDTWLIRGILETTKVDGRVLRGRRLFSVLAIFEAKLTADLVSELAMGPSEASKVARCAGADSVFYAPLYNFNDHTNLGPGSGLQNKRKPMEFNFALGAYRLVSRSCEYWALEQ